jgi:pimeloyl-ACP methyl ester carboxylesterase
MKKLVALFGVLAVLVLVYFVGPRFPKPVLDSQLPYVDVSLENIDDYVAMKESRFTVKANNQARVVWFNDSVKQQTDYALLYLHGFSASWYEGFPVNADFAKYFGCNAYFSRLAAHGLMTSDALIDMVPDSLYNSAKEALQLASVLGRKVIVMGTSTGGTLALKLAADFPDKVAALILLSPNVEINNSAAFLLSGPWGLQIARLSGGTGKHRVLEVKHPVDESFWYSTYRWEATVYLQQLVDASMTKDVFSHVRQPLFLGYYYKNESAQDNVVRVDALVRMFDEVATPSNAKVKMAFPNAGDHVIGNEVKSGSVDELREAVIDFGEKVLMLKKYEAPVLDSLALGLADSIAIQNEVKSWR